jgi:RNA polymerase sigma-70 factor (ECF subfamily)
VALDEFRRRQRLRVRIATAAEPWDLAVTTPPIEVRSALRDAHRVLSLLPKGEREVFSLRFIDGLELARIADVCDVSLATVKRRLVKAESRFMSLARRQPGLSDWMP